MPMYWLSNIVRRTILLLAGCVAVVTPGHGQASSCDDQAWSEADKVIAVGLFSGQILVYPGGGEEARIVAGWPSSFGIDPAEHPVVYALVKRAQKAATVHRKLLESDRSYRLRWDRAVRDVLDAIGSRHDLSRRQGTRILYPVFLRACIYEDIFARLGPPEVTDDPHYDGKNDPAVMPFHYCAGTGGLTVSGGTDEPHVRAMLWLKEHDPEFRRDWEEVLRKVAPEAEKVDPLDAEAGNRVTAFWRTLLLQGGEKSLAARIEARVREEQRERERRPRQENAPDHP